MGFSLGLLLSGVRAISVMRWAPGLTCCGRGVAGRSDTIYDEVDCFG